MSSWTREDFEAEYTNGDSFGFGSNVSGEIDMAGEVYVNSHNEELFVFDTIEDFTKYWIEDNEDIKFAYQYNIGQRDTDGDEPDDIREGCEDVKYDDDDDGADIWSLPVIITEKER